MDIEFHYYMTYLIAARAGFNTDDASIIAFASQLTDDNCVVFEISKNKKTEYSNYISQTMNILKPKKDLLRIYSHFHFIPGTPTAPEAKRKDGKMHWLNTTPDSENVNLIFDRAVETKDLYRIGISCHSFADTFAHQNFIGFYDKFNSRHGALDTILPAIGHATFLTYPDQPAQIWSDDRLFENIHIIYNKERFKLAAEKIYKKLKKFNSPNVGGQELNDEADKLTADLDYAIGETDKNNVKQEARINRYIELSQRAEYGSKTIDGYKSKRWINDAVEEDLFKLQIEDDDALNMLNPFHMPLNWKDETNYKTTNWYKFQEAVKNHQNDVWQLLEKRNFANVELGEF
jgi:hypothetical protein